MTKPPKQPAAPTVIPTDAVAQLFERRWRTECETSLLLADENRRLHALASRQAAEIERLKNQQEKED